MAEFVELAAGEARALLTPTDGAALLSLTVAGAEFLAADPSVAGTGEWVGGNYPLAPWPGTVPSRVARNGSERIDLPSRSQGKISHGFLLDRTWDVTGQGGNWVEFEHEITDGPWQGVAWQSYQLFSDRLEVNLEWTLEQSAPVGLGFHPWFVREADGSLPELDADFDELILADDAGVESLSDEPAATPRNAVHRGARIVPRLRWKDGRTLAVESESRIWVIYEQDPRGICVEPWTCTPGEFAAGERITNAGGTESLSMRLRWSQTG
ncbi:hypothetical protein [Microbacterium sp. ZW T5_56]|uniref:aldose epimerase family protein n=1 Tax=Microbacterium sp. ZW T5_56 TaxID=3378081 RepID=UPI003854CEBE